MLHLPPLYHISRVLWQKAGRTEWRKPMSATSPRTDVESVTPFRYRVLVCPNAFKGSLTAALAARAIAEGLARVQEPTASFEALCLPLADGGDGTLETLVEATGGEIHRATVRGPLGRPVEAAWGRLGGRGGGGGGRAGGRPGGAGAHGRAAGPGAAPAPRGSAPSPPPPPFPP